MLAPTLERFDSILANPKPSGREFNSGMIRGHR